MNTEDGCGSTKSTTRPRNADLPELGTVEDESTMTEIAIIGAGLSGRLLAVNLARQGTSAVSIRMIDRGDSRYMGPAYSNEGDDLLLNVRAGQMAAFSEDSDHFLRWVQERGVCADRLDFLPRRLFREYIVDLVRKAWQARTNGPSLEHVRAEVIDIETTEGRATIHVEAQEPFVVDRVVLALGNFLPRHPLIENRMALRSGRYARDPWAQEVLAPLSRGDNVILLGSGQTTVDLAVALYRRGHEGRIVAVSQHGLLPLGHRSFESYPSFFGEIKDSKRILDILRTVRKHLARAKAMGIDERAVIDSLRPDTQTLWSGIPTDEKCRFLRHLFRYWEIIRSRIPPESEAIIARMRDSGQFNVIAGRIRDFVETETALEVHYVPRGRTTEEVEKAALVINCIGPESNYSRVDQPLVRNLMERGLIRPGPANLGVDALPNGAVIGRDGRASDVLYTLGSTMRGVLWEVIAVPEIRVQAERLARLLVTGNFW
jgi:uncharacterized NAD(P)/FAD-binding protein YdhS